MEENCVQTSEKARTVVQLAESQMGSPYVFGAWGGMCTPSYRKQYAGYNPDHADAIKKKCRVLNGSGTGCAGCQYEGKRAFDCRGFTYWLLKQVGVTISGSGATSQYNTTANWAARGEIAGMPDVVCCVFKQSGGKMQHTGMHVGGGRIIHCSAGVQEGRTTDKGWTHYAIPAGLYEAQVLASAGTLMAYPTIKRGSRGEAVKVLQSYLVARNWTLDVDGIFGAKTYEAVTVFQAAQGLAVDGIVGPKTWAKLQETTERYKPDTYTVTIRGLDAATATFLLESYPGAVSQAEG